MNIKRLVVTLCGSTRYKDRFDQWNETLTLDGHLVFSCGVWGHLRDKPLPDTVKEDLDTVHRHKIRMSDAVLVVDPGEQHGESTTAEIAFAHGLDIPVYYANTQHVLDEITKLWWAEGGPY